MSCAACHAFDLAERAAIQERPMPAHTLGGCSCPVEQPIALTLWPTKTSTHGTRLALTWDELTTWIARPVVAEAKDTNGGYSLATFGGDGPRTLTNVERVHALGLDVDHGDARVARVLDVLSRYQTIAYTTHSHTEDAPRCRAVVALSRPVTAAEYARLWDHVAAHLLGAGVQVDRATRDASRLWYVPAVRAGAPYECASQPGEALDVERLLAADDEYRAKLAAELEQARTSIGASPTLERVRRYLSRIEGAVSGQHGHDATFRVACIVVANVASEAEQEALLEEFNARCDPPWSARELAHKLEGARQRSDLRPLASRPHRRR